jgi:hypothetical protein
MSIHRMKVLLFLAVALAFTATAASAQAPAREGFFIGFGLGWGSFGVEDAGERQGGGAGYLKLGGALSDKVLLGAESSAWTKEEGGATLTFGTLTATAYVYPSATGLYLSGGLGLARVEVDAGVLGSANDTGLGINLGAGYDIGFGGRFGLTPYANFISGSFDGGSANVFQLGLGVNWY